MLLAVLADGAFAAMAAMGFALISNPPRLAVVLAALLAAVGHALRFYLMTSGLLGITTASLVAAVTIGCLSKILAELFRIPGEFFSFPALLPMVPGMYAYKTVLSLMLFLSTPEDAPRHGLIIEIFHNGLTAVFVMCALVVGALLPLMMFRRQSFIMSRLFPASGAKRQRRRPEAPPEGNSAPAPPPDDKGGR